MTSRAPAVRFALPGRWLKAELDEPAAVAAVTDLLPDEHPGGGGGAWLDSLRAAGAQTLLLRVGSEPQAAIAFIWPPDLTGGDASPEALGTRLGLDGEPVAHVHGYATVRQRVTGEGSPRDVVTYGLAHPASGRVLVVRCMAFDGPFPDLLLEDLDLAAGDLTWDES
jgi:hypothetical protein